MGLWLDEIRTRLPLLRRRKAVPSMLAHVPSRELRTMIRHLARSQTPSHDPADEQLPAWVEDWHEAFHQGDDVTTYPGSRL